MTDILICSNPAALPESVARRWSWIVAGRIGFRQSPSWRWAAIHRGPQTLLLVGLCRGRRQRRRPTDLQTVAADLMADDEPPFARPHRWLGPIAGVWHHRDDGSFRVFRDRFGRLPLQCLDLKPGRLITSCPDTIASLSQARPHRRALQSFVHRPLDTESQDLFCDLQRLRPAEAIDLDGPTERRRFRWWHPRRRPLGDATASLRGLLHRMGDALGPCPHILALSSGLDSSTLALEATSRHPRSLAYTLCDPQSIRDEGPAARRTARELGLNWHRFGIGDHPPFRRLSDLGLPLAWGPTAHPDPAWKIPWHRHLRRRHPSYPLVYGNGADEALTLTPGDRSRSPLVSWRRAAQSLLPSPVEQSLKKLLRPSSPPWLQPHRWYPSPPDSPWPKRDRLAFLMAQLWSWRWERVVRSLAAEARRAQRPIWTPFLDAEFWNLSLSMNAHDLGNGVRPKSVLRRTMASRLPHHCLHRWSQGGFDAVVERGLLHFAPPYLHRWFHHCRLQQVEPNFRPAIFRRAFDAYRHAEIAPGSGDIRGSWPIWRTLAAEYWLQRLYRDG